MNAVATSPSETQSISQRLGSEKVIKIFERAYGQLNELRGVGATQAHVIAGVLQDICTSLRKDQLNPSFAEFKSVAPSLQEVSLPLLQRAVDSFGARL